MNDFELLLKPTAAPRLPALLCCIQAADVQGESALGWCRLAQGCAPWEGNREQTIFHAAIPGDGSAVSKDQLTIVRLLCAGAGPNGGWAGENTLDGGPLSWAILTSAAALIWLLVARRLDLRREGFRDVLQDADGGSGEIREWLRSGG